MERRSYSRRPGDERRDALIRAALAMVAEGGFPNATLRAIAERAGVTAGLVRHYFGSKDDLMLAAFEQLMTDMTGTADQASAAGNPTAAERLAAYVVASLRPPVATALQVAEWSGFLPRVVHDPATREIHRKTYLGFRDRLQRLIANLDPSADADRCRRNAIACNAVIDGLWLEASLLPQAFSPGEIEEIGLTAIERVLGIPPLPRPDLPAAGHERLL